MTELADHIATVDDAGQRKQCEALLEEMGREMSMGNFDRLAAYLLLSDDMALGHEQKASLALSGWLLGSDYAERNLLVTLSLAKARELVRRYMNEPVLLKRNEIETELRNLEGVSVQLVARLISHMKPPLETSEPSRETPGFYKLEVPIGIDREPDATYYVQLPPEYDPHVRYPTIVTLNALGATPQNQIDWWAGVQGPERRAVRPGHAARLHRDRRRLAERRPARIRLHGPRARHGAGQPARRLPSFLDRHRPGVSLWPLDRRRRRLGPGPCTSGPVGRRDPDRGRVAELLQPLLAERRDAPLLRRGRRAGRRQDRRERPRPGSLHETPLRRNGGRIRGAWPRELLRRNPTHLRLDGPPAPRNFTPKEFEVSTMRTWDNYFWWLEVGELPPKTIVEPSNWPPSRGVRATQLRGKVLTDGDLSVPSGAGDVTLWLTAELLPPGRDSINVSVGGRRSNIKVLPNLTVLLDDVRTRGDRLHPFWAKIQP